MELYGLVLSHSISTFITVLFCIIYILANITKLKDKEIIKSLVINSIFIILITSIFWAPLLEHKQTTDYEVFRENMMGSPQSMQDNAISPELFVKTKDNIIIYEIGLPIIILFLATPFITKRLPKEYKKTYYIFWIFGIISLFLCTKYFPWNKMPQIFGMIQFPWRFLVFAVFFLSITSGITLILLLKNKTKIVLIFILLILSIIPYNKYLQFFNTKFNEEKFYTPSKLTASQRINAGLAKFEYLPTKANLNKEYIENRNNDIYVLSGNATLTNINKNKSKMNFEINNATKGTVLELPYIYYLGYNVKINGEKINTQESVNGFIEIIITTDLENAKATVEYTGTTIMYVSASISIISFLSLIIYIILRET